MAKDGIIKSLFPPAAVGQRANDGSLNGAGQIEEVINNVPQGRPYLTFQTPGDVDQHEIPLKLGQKVTFETNSQGQIKNNSVKGMGLSCSIWADPMSVNAGDSYHIHYSSMNANSWSIDNGIGSLTSPSGVLGPFVAVSDVQYILTVGNGSSFDQCSATVSVS